MAPRPKLSAQELLAAAAELSAEERREVVAAQALALPVEERAKIVASIQASLAQARLPSASGRQVPRLLDLAGTGEGLWGEDSTEYVHQLRNEWD